MKASTKRHKPVFPFFVCLLPFTLSAAETKTVPAGNKISFDRDILPIFDENCFACHGPEKPKSDFRLDLRSEALKGGDDNTNDIVPGHSEQSWLMRYVSGQDEDIKMPPQNRPPLTAAQIAALGAWINEGANWGSNSAPAGLEFSIEPEARWSGVSGKERKFRELEGVPQGFGGGADHFAATRQISSDENLTITGHALVPENDVQVSLALNKNNVAFVHGGIEEWRKYFDDTGGYYPNLTPTTFSLNRDLHLDIGRAWTDFGLTLPDWPQIIFGYEYQFRAGAKSTLDWGTVFQGANAKNIYPDAEDINEHTHILKADIIYELRGWDMEDQTRVEVYHLGESRDDTAGFTTGPNPDLVQRENQNIHYTQGANTFSVERQLKPWWRISAGGLYSKFEGTSFFNQTALDGTGALTFGQYWSTEGITLARDSRVVSASSLFLPLKGLTISAAGQGEWTREEGFGNVDLETGDPNVPGLFFPFPGTVNANLDRTEFSELLNAQLTRLPRTVLFADASLRQQSVGQFDEADNATTDAFEEQVDEQNHLYDTRAGFTTSPGSWAEFEGHYRRRDSSTGYNPLVDESPSGGDGYPAFIRHRDIATDEIAGEISLRPLFWLNTRLTYQWNSTKFSSATAPTSDGSISPGGEILDGRTESDIFGASALFTPVQRFYFSAALTDSYSRTTTADDSDAAVVPYRGNIFTISSTAGFALNEKTDLNMTYMFSESAYGQNNSDGLPLGLDFTRHELLAGLTCRLTKVISVALHYRFSQYVEPGNGNANNFTAQGIFASVTCKWP